MSSHNPPIFLAKVDANEEANKELADKYEFRGFPTLKIVRNGEKSIADYKGPCDADGIVEYLKKQVGPASAEIKSIEDARNLIGEKNIVVVSVHCLVSDFFLSILFCDYLANMSIKKYIANLL